MSLSYSAITNHGKVTLGSVDSWGTNMSILKDPPKGIYTRRIDKVGQTSDITATIDTGTDRACEAILQYARGVNPSVSVSYNNTQSQNGNGLSAGYGRNGQAFLPYRVNRDGAFRPPVTTQYNLLPLSRLPRVWTSSFSNPAFVDYSKNVRFERTPENSKELRNNLLKTPIRPTAVYKIETPLDKPYETKFAIQSGVKTSANSGIRTMDRTQQNVLVPTKEINENPNHAFAQSNLNENRYVNNNEFNPDRYLQDTNVHSVDTIKGADYIQIGHLDDYIDMGDVRTRDAINIDYNTPLRGNERTDYIHDDLFQERNLPYYATETNFKGDKTSIEYIHDEITLDRAIPYHSAQSNTSGDKKISYIHDDIELGRNVPIYNVNTAVKGNERVSLIHDDIDLQRTLPEYQVNTMRTQNGLQKTLNPEYVKELYGAVPQVRNIAPNKTGTGDANKSARQVQLADRLQPGSFQNQGQIPSQNRASNVKQNFETDKAKMSRMVLDQQMGRFGSAFPQSR